MYVIIDYKGKQYKAQKGDILTVDKTLGEPGEKIEIKNVLLVSTGDDVKVGKPYVDGAMVTASITETFRDKKVLVLKYKSKKDYHRLIGHRETYTKIKIEDIVA